MKKRFIIASLLLLIVLSNLAIFAGCNSADEDYGLSFKESGIIMSNEVLSEKFNTNFSADINKELYDFTGEFNYLLCYSEELDYYAVYNMDSGRIMERSNGNVYDGVLDYKCYYGGYGSYFYQIDNTLYSTDNEWSASIDDAMANLNEYSENLMQASIEESSYKSRKSIKLYAESKLSQKTVKLTLCDANNRVDNLHYVDDFQYSSLVLANNLYANEDQRLDGYQYCYVENEDETSLYKIGFRKFESYDGEEHYDTLYPINSGGTCGIVAATMLLQYYDRNGILGTIPGSLYNQARKVLYNDSFYDRAGILTEIVHDEINSRHKDVLDGSTFVSVKDAINKYFSDFGISGISATSSVGYAGVQSAIDNDDPCIVFFAGAVLSSLKNDLSGYKKYLKSKHAMYTYGYTTSNTGVLYEFACHTGWTNTDCFNSITYISKTVIAGNVRLLY